MSDVFVLGIGCFLGGAGLTLFYYSESAKKEAAFLTSATRLTLNELGKLFDDDNEGVVKPTIVAVSGRVGSSTPMACKISGLKAVLVEEKAELQFKRKSHYDGSWIQDSTLMRSKSTKEVLWYLDDGTGQRVYVRGARGAHRFSFPVEKKAFNQYPTTYSDHKFVKMLGVKRTESLIPIGTSLTVIGKAVKDESGRVWIQPPPQHEGRFYVIRMTIDQLVAHLEQNARRFKEFAQFLMISVGLVLFLGWIKYSEAHVTVEIEQQGTRITVEMKHPEIKHPETYVPNLYAVPSNPNLYAVPSIPRLSSDPSIPGLYAVPKPWY